MKEKTLVILDPVLKKGFTAVPNSVLTAPRLSLPAKSIYAILLMFAWQEDECFPGQERLAEVANCTDRTIRKYLDELREFDLISWVQRGLNQTNIYYIHDTSKIQRLKALSDKDRKALSVPDRKGCSGQERKELSDKEYSVKRSVVVVEQPGVGKTTNHEIASSTVENDGAAFALPPANTDETNQVINHQTYTENGKEEEKPEEPPAWEQICSKVRAVAGVDISVSFAKEIEKKHPPEKVSLVLDELRRQLSQEAEIRGVGAWLRYALENDIQPDQPAKPSITHKSGDKNNNITSRDGPGGNRHKKTLEKERKKEFIKTLYI
ncbi:helix-turn-helix domain-containing protein [Pelotomaculum terephthalicicum JT]|uniref:helix-turn-helix domain-containing protein n=1 Tax=Pelotomaculum TaxID=191373 RepID=UPI0009CDE66A|nr:MULTISPECIES: helix-turn-helix domain-containing protein [Pelotomaculum]MCG9966748.1 helix-turn-helix domain-containing protein [Pelotomaculum terephthalicicum JT]OPX85562.1 MAG: hypothetical protein A4E54_02371 [Pelotomaculum sp. PtaB.Bin117]